MLLLLLLLYVSKKEKRMCMARNTVISIYSIQSNGIIAPNFCPRLARLIAATDTAFISLVVSLSVQFLVLCVFVSILLLSTLHPSHFNSFQQQCQRCFFVCVSRVLQMNNNGRRHFSKYMPSTFHYYELFECDG